MKQAPEHLKKLDWYLPHQAWLAKTGFSGHDPQEAEPSRADFTGVNLTDVNFMDAYLIGANLTDTNLTGANLTGANLKSIDFGGGDLTHANFVHADLRNTNLQDTHLLGANLLGANLRCASLWGANLRGAYLRSAVLMGANLTRADLTGANLTHADFTDAVLTGTCLDPNAPVPSCTDDQLIEAGLRPVGDRVYGMRTRKSLHVRSTVYAKRRWYMANALSADQSTACHPGIYFGGSEVSGRDDLIEVWAYRSEVVYVSEKKGVRARKIWCKGAES